jgi:hypothetical protein
VNIDMLENSKDSDKEKSRMLLVEGALSCIVDIYVAGMIISVGLINLTRSNNFVTCNKSKNKHASF